MTVKRGSHTPKPMTGKSIINVKIINPIDYVACVHSDLCEPECRASRPIKVRYRTNSTDELVLHETLTSPGWYRRPKFGFDVEPGEHWLDLGANIGAFAIYCWLRGATATCYEPDADNYKLLLHNVCALANTDPDSKLILAGKKEPKWETCHYAVTASKAKTLPFYKGRADNDFYKYSPVKGMYPYKELPNTYAGPVFKKHYDGCKMDIEGSEYALLDAELVPNCDKLVIEYHLRRNPDMKQFRRRMDVLRERFETVHYPKSLDSKFKGDKYPGFFDRLIFCYNH